MHKTADEPRSQTTEHVADCTCANCDPGRLGFKLPRSQSTIPDLRPTTPRDVIWHARWEELARKAVNKAEDEAVRFIPPGEIVVHWRMRAELVNEVTRLLEAMSEAQARAKS